MEVVFWFLIFVLAVVALVKGADVFVLASERIGYFFGLSPFIIGVVIVGLGTSLPELVSAIVAAFTNNTEIVLANAFGSNIFNILVIVASAALVSGSFIKIDRSLIDLDLPLLAISSVLVFAIAIDGLINRYEGLLLLLAYGIYLSYSFAYQPENQEKTSKKLPSRIERRKEKQKSSSLKKDFLLLFLGGALLIVGADYAVKSIVKLSNLLMIATSVITAIALAAGTSLPELAVSLRAAFKKNYELAIGNIFGSNIFNSLVVIGLPAIFSSLKADKQTLALIMPVFLAGTLLFVISGISKRIHKWEGGMYLLLYAFLVGKLLGVF